MKILITARHSYVGNSFVAWCSNRSPQFDIDFLSMRDKAWEAHNFSSYDVIFHVAGIAHISTKAHEQETYEYVNRDLTIRLAQKAKAEGVKQFIFMSSMLVYGDSGAMNENKVINRTTVPHPTNIYGTSKLAAEQGILPLQNSDFQVAIIRCPFIYGKDCKGNYQKLASLARKTPIFPDVVNARSMIYIDHLSEFVRLLITNRECGIFYPQNKTYVQSTALVRMIAEAHGHRIWTTRLLNPLLAIFSKRVSMINKLFGNLVYDQHISTYKQEYRLFDLKTTIERTEKSQL